jgi:hypothetical protein
VADVQFVCSLPNWYTYKGVTYPVCDLMFRAAAVNAADAAALDGATAFGWYRLGDIDPAELAFPSVRRGLEVLRGRAGA